MRRRISLFSLIVAFFLLQAFSQVPTNGLVAYYPFNGSASDESCNNNGGFVQGPTPCADRFGRANNAFSFRGDSGCIQGRHFTGIDTGNSQLTFSIWYKSGQVWTDYLSVGVLVGLADSGSRRAYTGIQVSDSKFVLNNSLSNLVATPYFDNKWHHCVFTHDSTAVRFFIDDTLRDSEPLTYYMPKLTRMIMGHQFSPSAQGYSGVLDDIRIYNRALSVSEINALFHEGTSQTLCPIPCSLSPCSTLIDIMRPTFYWLKKPGISQYSVQVASDSGFSSVVSSATNIADTVYVPSADLPAFATLFWRVGNANTPGQWSKPLSFFLIDEKEPGIVGYYPFGPDDIAGNSIVHDSSGYYSNGQTTVSALAKDRFGNSSSAMAMTQHGAINFPSIIQLKMRDSLSLCAWARSTTTNDAACIVEKSGQWGMNLSSYYLQANGEKHTLNNAKAIIPGTWNHVAATWDGAFMKFYLNGELQPESTAVNGTADLSDNALTLGCIGSMDDVRIYRRALSAAEVSALYKYNNWPRSSPVPQPLGVQNALTERPTYLWWKSSVISSYRVQVAKDSLCKTVYIDSTTSDTSMTPSMTLPAGASFWRVSNASDTTTWSMSLKFTAAGSAIVLKPTQGSANRRPQFAWYKNPLAGQYRLLAASDTTFKTVLVDVSLTDTVYTPTSNLPTGPVSWKVVNPADTFMRSSVSTFAIFTYIALRVPDDCKSLKTALDSSENIILTGPVTEDVQIAGRKCSIIGSFAGVNCSGSWNILNSTVRIENLSFHGDSAAYKPVKDSIGVFQSITPPCMVPCICNSAAFDANGLVYVTISNSKVIFQNSFAHGGDAYNGCGVALTTAKNGSSGIVAANSTLWILNSLCFGGKGTSGAIAMGVQLLDRTVADTLMIHGTTIDKCATCSIGKANWSDSVFTGIDALTPVRRGNPVPGKVTSPHVSFNRALLSIWGIDMAANPVHVRIYRPDGAVCLTYTPVPSEGEKGSTTGLYRCDLTGLVRSLANGVYFIKVSAGPHNFVLKEKIIR